MFHGSTCSVFFVFKILMCFRNKGNEIWFLVDPLSLIIIITEQNYLYQLHCLVKTFPAMHHKIYLLIWNFKVDLPSILFRPLPTGLKYFHQKTFSVNSLNVYFDIFQNSDALPRKEGERVDFLDYFVKMLSLNFKNLWI